ncbi:MAG: hypothetical protein B6I18_00885 [Bacteroidetes bacterium 4572_112]|nr:MAG: hypothetical protein B6I18_00885 [Bacteroidetes bacterium 4572_112]
MKKTIYIIIAILAITVISATNGLAQKVYDVFSNEYMPITNSLYKEVNVRNSIFKNEVEVLYFKIKNEDTKAIKSINKQAYAICLDYLTNEKKSMKLMSELEQRLRVRNELQNSKNDDYDRRAEYNQRSNPPLHSIKSSIISRIADKLFIRVDFNFKSEYSRNYYDSDDINISHYYVANIKSAKVKRWKNDLTNKQLSILQENLSEQLNRNYSQANSELKLSEIELLKSNEEYQENNRVEECKNICTRIDLYEADFYCYAWGIIVDFQEYTNSSKIYYGEKFQLFIPYTDAKQIFKNIPKFAFLNHIPNVSTHINNFNILDFYNKAASDRRAPEAENIVELNGIKNSPKSLSIIRSQILRDNTATNFTKQEFEYNTKGQILSKILYQGKGNVFYRSTFYSYDSAGLLLSKIVKYKDNREESESYTYDHKNNLSRLAIRSSSDDENSNKLYFYNGNNIYYFTMDNAISVDNSGISRLRFDKNRIYNTDKNYFAINDKRQIEGIVSLRNYNNQGQFGRDSLDRIIEYHNENDRYNYYWNYDSLNRLVEFEQYEFQKNKLHISFLYQGENMLPYKRINIQKYGGNNTVLEKELKWEMFEE